MTKAINYTVRGHWPFPTIDMLRRDDSRAATPADQDLIDRLSTEHATDPDAFTDVEISLTGPNRPCTPRWESFGWSVPSDAEHAFAKELRQRQEAEDRVFNNALKKLTPLEREVVLSRTERIIH
jgi:hypothetical protein